MGPLTGVGATPPPTPPPGRALVPAGAGRAACGVRAARAGGATRAGGRCPWPAGLVGVKCRTFGGWPALIVLRARASIGLLRSGNRTAPAALGRHGRCHGAWTRGHDRTVERGETAGSRWRSDVEREARPPGSRFVEPNKSNTQKLKKSTRSGRSHRTRGHAGRARALSSAQVRSVDV